MFGSRRKFERLVRNQFRKRGGQGKQQQWKDLCELQPWLAFEKLKAAQWAAQKGFSQYLQL